MPTQSEMWLEEYCNSRSLPLSRVPEEATKTPDYILNLDGAQIILEVKEITLNPSEKASLETLKKEGVGLVTGGVPGERLRGKIADASPQIKARTEGKHPSLLVACDIKHGCGQITGHLDSYNIRVAMEGLDQIIVAVPKDMGVPPTFTGTKSGPRKKMTASANTSISGIAVLSTPPGKPIDLHVYHNNHSAVPIPEAKLRKYGIRQFRLCGNPGEPSEWIEI